MKRFSNRRRSSSQKRPVQWVTNTDAWGGNASSTYTGNSLDTTILMETGTSQLTTGGDTYLMPQRFTVMRIVGDWDYYNTSATNPSRYTAAVILVDEVGSTEDAMNPTVLSNADKSWLWMDHGMVAHNASTATWAPAVSGLFGKGHIDIRVKRIMKPDQVLQFAFAAEETGKLIVNVRCLVSRVA